MGGQYLWSVSHSAPELASHLNAVRSLLVCRPMAVTSYLVLTKSCEGTGNCSNAIFNESGCNGCNACNGNGCNACNGNGCNGNDLIWWIAEKAASLCSALSVRTEFIPSHSSRLIQKSHFSTNYASTFHIPGAISSARARAIQHNKSKKCFLLDKTIFGSIGMNGTE